MTGTNLLVLGNANVDLILGKVDGWPKVGTEVTVEHSEMRAGGSAGNSALALTGMGHPHLFIGSTGNDSNGFWLHEQFDRAKSIWITEDCNTSLTVAIVHQGGDRAFFTTPGHLLHSDPMRCLEFVPEPTSKTAVALISGSFLMPHFRDQITVLFERLTNMGWQTAVDPGWPVNGWGPKEKNHFEDCLDMADFLLVNEEELRGFSEINDYHRASRHVSRCLSDSQCLVVKKGAEGACSYRAGEEVCVQAPQVIVVDTVGAGDTFNAAFLAEVVNQKSIGEALQTGVNAAALAISTRPRSYAGQSVR